MAARGRAGHEGAKMTQFWVAGLPVPQGSSRAFVVAGRARITSTSGHKLQDWRQAIASEARFAFQALQEGPVRVQAVFYVPRPTSRAKRDLWPDRKPDVDKLARAALDALTGVAFKDDAQVVQLEASKHYAVGDKQPGVLIDVAPLLRTEEGAS